VNHWIPQPLIFICLFAILLAGSSFLFRRHSIVMRVPARYESVRLLAASLSQVVRNARLGEQEAFACRLALDEACVNIIEHAYADQPVGEIELALQAGPGICEIRLTHFGQPYDPSQIRSPEFGVTLDQVRTGGLGLFLMRTLMDDVQYVAGPAGNCLTMVKRRSFQT
jgi:serine/threonine-protein kinase RsbW